MIFPSISLIKKLQLKLSKRFGQNFLIDQTIASKTVDYAHITPMDTVIEVGAGLGSLTFFLLQKGAATFSFEIDKQLFQFLKDSLPQNSQITLINKDILQVSCLDFTRDNHHVILIGSIPYSITTPILFKFLKESCIIRRAVFVMQKEVAQRLCALPGSKDYGTLSVYSHAYIKTFLHMTVPPGCFYPKPKVDSAIIELVPLQKRNWNDEGQALFRQVLRASFSQRRKTLFNCLKGFISQKNLDPKLFMNESIKEGIDLKRRAETLTVDEFYKLTAVLNKLIQ